MQQIIDDEDAAAVLPSCRLRARKDLATKGALALMGKAYLYWADLSGDDATKFDAAASALQEVVDLGAYELVTIWDRSTPKAHATPPKPFLKFSNLSTPVTGVGLKELTATA